MSKQKIAAAIGAVIISIAAAIGINTVATDEPYVYEPIIHVAYNAESRVTMRASFSYAVPTETGYELHPLKCDGTDNLDGVGDVQMIVDAKREAPSTRRFRTNFIHPDPERDIEKMYSIHNHVLTTEWLEGLSDFSTELEPDQNIYRISEALIPQGPRIACEFTANNIPETGLGIIQSRSIPTDTIELTRIDPEVYKTGEPKPCGGPGGGRLRNRVMMKAPEQMTVDGHWHQEFDGSIGPNQEQSLPNTRFMEEGLAGLPLEGLGQWEEAYQWVISVGVAGEQNISSTFHTAQQAPGNYAPQSFCHLVN